MNTSFIGQTRVSLDSPADQNVPIFDSASGLYKPGAVPASGGSSAVILDEIQLDATDITNGYHDLAEFSTWNSETVTGLGSRYGYGSAVFFKDYYWIIGGSDSARTQSVYKSSNGITWTLVTSTAGFGARNQHAVIAYGGKLWVIAGYTSSRKNDVWSSSDGTTWTQVTVTSGFLARWGLTSWVFNNKMYISGGETGTNTWANDVYSSTDGATWTQETGSAFASGRWFCNSIVFNNKIYIFGGKTNTTLTTQIYVSTDGINFALISSPSGWSNRFGCASGILNNKLFIVGGSGALTEGWIMDTNETFIKMPATGFSKQYFGMITIGTKIYALAGYTGSASTNTIYSYSGDIDIYDPRKMKVNLKSGTSNIEVLRNQERAIAGATSDFILDGTKIYFDNKDSHTNLSDKPIANDVLIVEVLP